MRLLQRIRGLDWVALSAEVVLIFVGITLALWFDNLNQARQAAETERTVLYELVDALAADMRDIRGNHREDSLTLQSIEVSLIHLEQQLPYSDSLAVHFAQAAGITLFIHDAAAYEHLKSAGLDIIRDDSLRLAIIDYYEHRVPLAREWERQVALPVWQDHMDPQMIRKFRYSDRKVPAQPLDYAALKNDEVYQNILGRTASVLSTKDLLYRRVASSAEALRSRINEALAERR